MEKENSVEFYVRRIKEEVVQVKDLVLLKNIFLIIDIEVKKKRKI